MTDGEETRSQRKARRRRAFRELRERVENRPRPGCPTPWKPAYDRTDPLEANLQDRRMPWRGGSYDCKCGFSHNTSQEKS